MNALLLFTGHLKGLCTDFSYMKHYHKMCTRIFDNCEFVMITYHNVHGTARNSQKYNVNEVGLKLGYSTASHFIAAFKKKYGTTPKKYLGSVSS